MYSTFMKTKLLIQAAFLCLSLSMIASGTPDHRITSEERILGSNPDSYITLRTETDNQGSYYHYRTKRFLVEYSKTPSDPKSEQALGPEVRSQLLLDVTTSLDVDGKAPPTEKIETQDHELKLADLLARFPMVPAAWSSEKLARIECHSTGGPRIGNISLAWGGWIKERFGVDRNSDLEWTLAGVQEDGNCLYLSVQSENHGQRWVSISLRMSRIANDQMTKQAVYLVAGSFIDPQEAMALGRELMDQCKGKFTPEVWSSGSPNGEMIYFVVDSHSTEHIQSNQFERLEALTGKDLSVISSKQFVERMAISPSQTTP